MKRLLVTEHVEKEIDFDPAAHPVAELESGSAVVLLGGEVHRITRAGDLILVNGKQIRLSLADPRDRRRNASANGDSGRRDVKAAMPGKVVKTLVNPGDIVEAGAGLLILEAMKMQNEVRSQRAGRVAAVRVAVADTVASGQVLVTLE